MKKLVSLAFVGLFGVMTAFGQAVTNKDNVRIPIDIVVFVPCADGGAGELVALSGALHSLFHVTINKKQVSFKSHDNPQGVSGEGLTTGDKYQGTGVTQYQANEKVGGFPWETTYINNFRIIGQGPGNNFLVHENVHVTVNANGEVTADVGNFSVECK